ncbi:hypothetical protein BTR23_09825 [Alkalihalophilus pseudofirmus]|nr:hypothetical protein BTR23_09825 [Alkalihalophilus pseudofirmus]
MAKKKGKKEQHQLEVLKSVTLKSEESLNKLIHKLLEDPEIMNLIKLGSKKHAHLIKKVREYSEMLALQLNIPTKNDVANVAQLVRQIEEKLDAIEEKLIDLMQEAKKPVSTKKETGTRKKRDNSEVKEKLIKDVFSTSPNNSLVTSQLLERLLERRKSSEKETK